MLDDAALRAVRGIALFGGVDPARLARMTAGAAALGLVRGQTLFVEGEAAVAMFVVIAGQIKLYRSGPDGDEAIVHVCGPGDTFAEAALFLSGHHTVSAAAIETTMVVRLPAEAIKAAIRDDPGLAFAMLGSMAHHQKTLVDQLDGMKRLSGDDRVANLLLSLTDVASGPAAVTLPQEKAVIASRLGITPESFSRALTRLRAEGIEVSGNHVRIRDVSALRARVR